MVQLSNSILSLTRVRDKLPDKLRAVTGKRMRQAYHPESALKAEAELEALARALDKAHPGAASSLREGIAETLTIAPLLCWLARGRPDARSSR